ncbi:hypothetical protein SCUCBS95973_008983 [Sporothrix curviconia]|uniref:DUF6546 domain-containing protein n=1 Tax=Sporothrix curviconia TaxID=1260050 RepID=A0ABP0CRD6_9PEZI
MSAEVLRHTRPCLYLAVLAAASFEDAALQRRLGQQFNAVVASRLTHGSMASLDLLQGLLVHTACIVSDMRLDRAKTESLWNVEKEAARPDEFMDPGWGGEELRALLGAYYLSSISSIVMQKMRHFPSSQFIVDSGARLAAAAECPTDAYLPHIVRIQVLAEEADDILRQPPSDAAAKAVLVRGQLNVFKASLSFRLSQCSTLYLQVHFLELLLERMALPGFPFGNKRPSTTTITYDAPLADGLATVVAASRSLISFLLNMAAGEEFVVTNMACVVLSCGMSLAVRLDVLLKDPRVAPMAQHLGHVLTLHDAARSATSSSGTDAALDTSSLMILGRIAEALDGGGEMDFSHVAGPGPDPDHEPRFVAEKENLHGAPPHTRSGTSSDELWDFLFNLPSDAPLEQPIYAWAPYAAVSRDWQAFFERRSFASLALFNDDVEPFCAAVQRRPERLAYMGRLRLTIDLPAYDCEECGMDETAATCKRNNVIFTAVLWRLLRGLAVWKASGDDAGEQELQLELGVRSISDGQHMWQDYRILHPYARGIGRAFDDEGTERYMETTYASTSQRHRTSRDPPVAAIVRTLVVARRFYRAVHPDTLYHLLHACLPGVQRVHFEPWRPQDTANFDTMERGYGMLLADLPPSLRRLNLFLESNRHLYRAHCPETGVRLGPTALVHRRPSAKLGRQLAEGSNQLAMINVAFFVEADDVFAAAASLPTKTHTWPRLAVMVLTSSTLSPTVSFAAIEQLLLAAAAAAARMPQLREFELWNVAGRHACTFSVTLAPLTSEQMPGHSYEHSSSSSSSSSSNDDDDNNNNNSVEDDDGDDSDNDMPPAKVVGTVGAAGVEGAGALKGAGPGAA